MRIDEGKKRCYFLLNLHCGTTLCALWFVLGQTTVLISVHCGVDFDPKKHAFFLVSKQIISGNDISVAQSSSIQYHLSFP